ncbi:MAG: UDP-N-acetylmuramoyl-L-alanine--D-glutamate ligase [Oscillospiraceae bacterium]|nr:UDP-N-acetylmuramoyl-L-alanine--D-glutamate ligase [Oscillospiraceae bacterium]
MTARYETFIKKFNGKRVAVLGFGVSNTPLVRLLLEAGAIVTVCDKREKSEFDPAVLEEFSAAEMRLGGNYLNGLDHDVIFRTPGMRPDLPEIASAVENGAVLTSEMEEFFALCPCPIIGVTGSDGKTTTTTIIYELLKAEGKTCYVGGNIGTPLLARAGEMEADHIVVLELSSFQLMTMKASPEISVVTNIAPNHLDVHTSMEEYTEAKTNLYRNRADGRVVLNLDNEITRELGAELSERACFFSRKEDAYVCVKDGAIYRGDTRVLAVSDIRIPGLHNVENYMAAIAAVEGLVSDETVRRVAREFAGVRHRMELVRELSGVKYYNDSIASSPTRTIVGLRAFPQKVILIAGGKDKGVPFTELGVEAIEHCKAVVLNGPTMDVIYKSIVSAPGYDPAKLPVYRCGSFEEAVACAHNIAQSGDIVTLSPACTSFDRFKNFAERGDYFRTLVGEFTE